jgi:hypothetical protein
VNVQETMNVGAVGALRHCKQAILAARRVLENTEHSLLVGLQATQFAVEMAVPLDNLTTEKSHSMWKDWQDLLLSCPSDLAGIIHDLVSKYAQKLPDFSFEVVDSTGCSFGE